MEEICECDGHTTRKISQQRLTADWLAPRESDCSLMRSKVSSDWLPSYIKATRPVLEISKNDWIFSGQTPYVRSDSPCTYCCFVCQVQTSRWNAPGSNHTFVTSSNCVTQMEQSPGIGSAADFLSWWRDLSSTSDKCLSDVRLNIEELCQPTQYVCFVWFAERY